jgi:hypothetical protein
VARARFPGPPHGLVGELIFRTRTPYFWFTDSNGSLFEQLGYGLRAIVVADPSGELVEQR